MSRRNHKTTRIARDRTLLNSNGSSLIEGNLLVVPVGNSFLYFQPLYLQASSTQGLPQLKAVLMTDATGQTVVAYQPTLQLALNQLIGEAPPTQITSGSTTTQPIQSQPS